MFQLKEQLLAGIEDRKKGCILEAVAMVGWLSNGPQLQPAVLEVLDAAWDELERKIDERMLISGGCWRIRMQACSLNVKLFRGQTCRACPSARGVGFVAFGCKS